ncbi:MAG: PEP-CTERM sorting domain-containing protein [Opitutales bacterium]
MKSAIFIASILSLTNYCLALSPASLSIRLNHLTYSGNWTKYANLTDATNSSNPDSTGAVLTRDLEITYRAENLHLEFAPFWYSSSNQNPSNVRESFLQMQDANGTTITSEDFSYEGVNNEKMNLKINGANARTFERDQNNQRINNNEFCRGGVGTDNTAGSVIGDDGDWLSYSMDITFTGTLSGDEKSYAVTDVTGSFFILFQHKDSRHTDLNGYYRIDLDITDDGSWAVANSSPELITDHTITVPEPSTCALIVALAVGGFCVRSRRRA